MERVREVKKSFCIMSVAYIVLGLLLLIWPDISMKTFCYVFGVGMIIFGLAHIIIYFTKDKFQSVMQMDMVIGIVCAATGAYALLKMEHVLEIIPFALGIVALLGAVVKLQNAIDLKRLGSKRWYIMLIFSVALFVLGGTLVANPFASMQVIVALIGASLIVDGVGNLIGIFWIGHVVKKLNKAAAESGRTDIVDVAATVTPDVEQAAGAEEPPAVKQ